MKRRDDDEKQRAMLKNAMEHVGAVRGGDPRRAAHASDRVKDIIRKRHASAGTSGEDRATDADEPR